MSDASSPNNTAFPAFGAEQGYIVEKNIVTVEEILTRFSSFEPFEIALGINEKILAGKMGMICGFPKPFLLCKSRYDKYADAPAHCLLEADTLFPFRYTWSGDVLSFDFTGIVFTESEIGNIEYGAANDDFRLSRHDKAPQPYARLAFLREKFPADGPESLIASLLKDIPAPSPVTRKNPAAPKDMRNANEQRRKNLEERWKSQFSSGVAAAAFCLEQYRKTGKPVTRKDYEAALREQGHTPLMIEAESLFRKLLPPEVLHRGD